MAATTLAARAEVIDIDWGADRRFDRNLQIAPGKFAEICGKLAGGAAVKWDFDAAAPLDFNIHFHEGKKVLFPVKQDGTAKAEGTLAVTLAQDYCWMWTNKGSGPVSLRVRLAR